MNIGAIITEINYKGINRVLRFKELDSYLDNTMYLGATVGRTAGRIRDGVIPGGQLQKNFLNKHNLHGNDLHKVFYNVETYDDYLILTYTDPSGDYPGELKIEIEYRIEDNVLSQSIRANSDVPTLINFTNHTYFNLNGTGKILNHKLMIESELVGKLNSEFLIDEFIDVENTAFSFKKPTPIINSLVKGNPQFLITGFIDHPYKLNGDIKLAGEECTLTINTNQEYLVAYLGSQICNESKKLANNINESYVGLCLETQACPGSLELKENYHNETRYTFE